MALNLFSKNHSVETDRTIVPSFDALVNRVNVLAGECARLSRELADLRAQNARNTVAPSGILSSAGAADPKLGGRALMALIAVRLGKNPTGDTIRKALVTAARFEPARQASAAQGLPITRNVPMLQALADSPKLAELFS